MERITYHGWENCYRLSNGGIELVVTADVGPRVIRFGFVDGENEFYEDPALLGTTDADGWVNYGGHRLWHAPEMEPRTYAPDNAPVEVVETDGGARFVQPVESSTGIQKTLEITVDAEAAHVDVVHRLRNTNLWAVTLAPWAISVMAPGGVGVLPLPPRGTHDEYLLPNTRLTLWAYTDMRDDRFTWGTRHVLLRQVRTALTEQKVGTADVDGWVGYVRQGHLFLTTFAHVIGAPYPDLGASAELFTNDTMLEVETLGPLTELAPGAEVVHKETWRLFDDVPPPVSDEDVEATIWPLLDKASAEA